jgi:hypothetical protein
MDWPQCLTSPVGAALKKSWAILSVVADEGFYTRMAAFIEFARDVPL